MIYILTSIYLWQHVHLVRDVRLSMRHNWIVNVFVSRRSRRYEHYVRGHYFILLYARLTSVEGQFSPKLLDKYVFSFVSAFSHLSKNPLSRDSFLGLVWQSFQCRRPTARVLRNGSSYFSTSFHSTSAERGSPNTRSRYLRISAGSFAIPAAKWEGVDRPRATRGDGGGRYGVQPYEEGGEWRGQRRRGANNETLSHRAPAIRSSKPTE